MDDLLRNAKLAKAPVTPQMQDTERTFIETGSESTHYVRADVWPKDLRSSGAPVRPDN